MSVDVVVVFAVAALQTLFWAWLSGRRISRMLAEGQRRAEETRRG